MINYSVLIPVYNQKFQLQMLLFSLQRQIIKPSQVVVVDDSSDTDRELQQKVCEHFGVEYHYLPIDGPKWFSKTKAYNHGIGYIESEYVSLLDADSLLMPDYHERCIEAVSDIPDGIVLPIRVNPLPDKLHVALSGWMCEGSWEHAVHWTFGTSTSNKWSTRKNYRAGHLGSTQGCNFLKTERAKLVRWSDITGWGGEDEDFLMRCVIDGGVILYMKDLQVLHTDVPGSDMDILHFRMPEINETMGNRRNSLISEFDRCRIEWQHRLERE